MDFVSVLKIAVFCLAAWTVFVILLRRVSSLAQPYRLKMARLGEELLASNLAPKDREAIEFCLRHAFSGWIALGAVVLLPVAFVSALTHRPAEERDRRYSEFADCFVVSVLAANPVVGVLLFLEFVVFGLAALLVRGPMVLPALLARTIRAEMRLVGAS